MKNRPARKSGRILQILIIIITLLISLFFSRTQAQIDYSQVLGGRSVQEIINRPEIIDKMKQKEATQPQNSAKQQEEPSQARIAAPAAIEKKADTKPSSIERMYEQRYSEERYGRLTQYGYDFFNYEIINSFISVSDDYKAGPGDNISVYFWGDPVDILGMNGLYSLQVDRDGKIFIPSIGVFYVWGLDLGQIKNLIHNAINRKFKNFSIEVALGSIREFPVYVAGYVKRPGIIFTTGVGNIIDIISSAGGVTKNGSLRSITIKRQSKEETKTITVDLYDLLIYGRPLSFKIMQGDSICAGPTGKTAGITGVVKRPAIYELKDGADTIEDMISISGGCLPSARLPQVKLIKYVNNKIEIAVGSFGDSQFLKKRLADGDLLIVEDLYILVENKIEVRGHVAYPGKYEYRQGMKLSDLIKNIGILPDTNMLTASIIREETAKAVNFIPERVISGQDDAALTARDTVTFYPRWMYKPIEITGQVKNPSLIPYYEDITLMDALHSIEFTDDVRNLKAELSWRKGPGFDGLPDNAKASIAAIVSEQRGHDEESNPFPDSFYKTVYLGDLLIKAEKGPNIKVPPSARILITKTQNIEKAPVITLTGQVQMPGLYSVKKGERLYDYIKRAGGYSENAYPQGIILIRQSARRLQEEHINLTFLSMEESLAKHTEAIAVAGSSNEENMMLQFMLTKYKQALDLLRRRSELAIGRIALDIPADIKNLKSASDNIELIDGDYVYIPFQPNYILVLGEVYNQLTLPYEEARSVKYYLNQLGNVTENANRENIYIIKANGKVISSKQFSSFFDLHFSIEWDKRRINFMRDFEDLKLEQGDTIVVPSELKVPVMWRPILKDIVQIMFQSVSTVFMATKI